MLPNPINGTEMYLAALLEEMRALREELHAARQRITRREDGAVRLQEPDVLEIPKKKR